MTKVKIGVIQLCSKLEPKENLDKINGFLVEAKSKGCSHAFLPECFYSYSNATEATPHLVEKDNPHWQAIRKLAIDSGLFIIGGSAATKHSEEIRNRAYNFSPAGEDLGHYDKNHLFSCDLGEGKKIDEGNIYHSGNEGVVITAGDLKVGLSICFDIRFPEMYMDYKRIATVLTASAAFTVPTGAAHWHTLLRARAIENQCFMVASAQWGQHNEKMTSYGHSLVVDPWGEVLLDLGEGEKLGVCELDLDLVEQTRKKVITIA